MFTSQRSQIQQSHKHSTKTDQYDLTHINSQHTATIYTNVLQRITLHTWLYPWKPAWSLLLSQSNSVYYTTGLKPTGPLYLSQGSQPLTTHQFLRVLVIAFTTSNTTQPWLLSGLTSFTAPADYPTTDFFQCWQCTQPHWFSYSQTSSLFLWLKLSSPVLSKEATVNGQLSVCSPLIFCRALQSDTWWDCLYVSMWGDLVSCVHKPQPLLPSPAHKSLQWTSRSSLQPTNAPPS